MDKKRIKTELLIHDLKNPLAVIEAGINLLINDKKNSQLAEKQKKILKRALRNTKIAKSLVNDILEVGRSNEGVSTISRFYISDSIRDALSETFDLKGYSATELLKDSVELAEIKEKLLKDGIVLEIREDLWGRQVNLDERKIRQILRNLLNNAIRYRKERIEIRIETKDDCLFISVKDDGTGIDKSYHEKIFKCYFQLDEEKNQCIRGHGLGLAGILILVEDMGGRMSLESEKGKGATFMVTIPINKEMNNGGY